MRNQRTAHGTVDATSAATISRCTVTETPSGDHRRTEQRAGDGSDAEAGVEPRHDRAPEPLLDERALHVHRDVPGAVPRAEQEQPDDDRRDADLVADRRDRETDRRRRTP